MVVTTKVSPQFFPYMVILLYIITFAIYSNSFHIFTMHIHIICIYVHIFEHFILFPGQSCSSEESVDPHAASSSAGDHVPMLSNHDQLPNIPLYTTMDYERTLMIIIQYCCK